MINTRTSKGAPLTHAEMDTNFNELDEHPDGIKVSEVKGKGIRLDPLAPSFGWHDLNGTIQYDPTANNPPMVAAVGGIKFPQFDVGHEGFIYFHLPHDYVPGSHLQIHTHWLHNCDFVTGGSVDWGMEVTYAKGYEQEAFSDTISFTVTAPVNTGKMVHIITENELSSLGGSSTTLDTARMETDGLVFCRFSLNSNDITVSEGAVPSPFLISVDIHYQSTGLPTIWKNGPNFWSKPL